MKQKPYHDWVPLANIVADGWSRGFHPEQTVDEAAEMGFTITIIEVKNQWKVLTDNMNSYLGGIDAERNHR